MYKIKYEIVFKSHDEVFIIHSHGIYLL